ncbi:MAG: 50S ribosomal protein L11 methyltransferase [Desulfuromonadales bacterium]|nr:50S ribosomal protein L11 methyltransferase [Desulfuromonadales bacterium]
MNNDWLEIHLTVPNDAIDPLCAVLNELGSTGVTVEERELDTFVPPDPDEQVTPSQQLKAYFSATTDVDALLDSINRALRTLSGEFPERTMTPPRVERLQPLDWAENWKQNFFTFHIGDRLVVKPSWEDHHATRDETVINIDPGMAFGTGTHATTRLCLEALVTFIDAHPRPRVLDVGTGSGILAIAAAALGAQHVVACDIDPGACHVASENARLNQVAERIEITATPLENLPGGFDLILANILAEENIRLLPEFLNRLNPQGVLVLSGILIEKEPQVCAAFHDHGLSAPIIRHEDEWTCIQFRRER